MLSSLGCYRAFVDLKRLERAYQAFVRCHGVVVAARSETELYDDVCKMMVNELGYRLAWIGLVSEADQRVRPVAQAGCEAGYVDSVVAHWADDGPGGLGPIGVALRECRPQIIQDIDSASSSAPWRKEAAARGYVSMAVIPLCNGATRLGVLNLYAAEPNSFDDDEIALLEEMAVDLVLGVDRFRYEQRLQQTEILAERGARAETATIASATIAHDANNALQLVALMIRSAQTARDATQRDASLVEALQGTISIASMIRQFVSLTRHALDSVEHLNVDDVIGPMRQLLCRLAPRATLVFRLDAAGGGTCIGRQDLERIVINLVVNAGQSLVSKGTITLSTKHRRVLAEGMEATSGRLPEGHYVEIVVGDDGAGIEADVLPQVFEPFFTTKGDTGTGLGLVSVLHLVCRCGGGVSIASRVGVGTQVSVFLPLASL